MDVCCPWDVICYCDKRRDDPVLEPQDYWSNTSSNDLARHFVEMVDQGLTRRELEDLIAGEAVTKEIHQELTYQSLYDFADHIWSVLFTTGYQTLSERPVGKKYQLVIPNREMWNIFTEQIMTMFREEARMLETEMRKEI